MPVYLFARMPYVLCTSNVNVNPYGGRFRCIIGKGSGLFLCVRQFFVYFLLHILHACKRSPSAPAWAPLHRNLYSKCLFVPSSLCQCGLMPSFTRCFRRLAELLKHGPKEKAKSGFPAFFVNVNAQQFWYEPFDRLFSFLHILFSLQFCKPVLRLPCSRFWWLLPSLMWTLSADEFFVIVTMTVTRLLSPVPPPPLAFSRFLPSLRWFKSPIFLVFASQQ